MVCKTALSVAQMVPCAKEQDRPGFASMNSQLRRQFLAFTRGHWGKRDRLLAQASHKKTRTYRILPNEREGVSRLLPQAIPPDRQGNFRNRREHEIEYIQRRIGMLDFVLSHPEYKYLETEPDEASYFCDQ